jgi:homeobox protein cut-like
VKLNCESQEITSAYQRLNRLERGVLVVTRGILGNRRTRIFFICYALGLHALVLFASYECTPSSSSRYVTRPSPGA